MIVAYLRRRGILDEHIPLLVKKADGNWLHAYLLAERAVRPGFDPGQLPIALHPSLAELYGTELLAVGAGDRDRWETQLRPVLAVCAAAGTGPAAAARRRGSLVNRLRYLPGGAAAGESTCDASAAYQRIPTLFADLL